MLHQIATIWCMQNCQTTAQVLILLLLSKDANKVTTSVYGPLQEWVLYDDFPVKHFDIIIWFLTPQCFFWCTHVTSKLREKKTQRKNGKKGIGEKKKKKEERERRDWRTGFEEKGAESSWNKEKKIYWLAVLSSAGSNLPTTQVAQKSKEKRRSPHYIR